VSTVSSALEQSGSAVVKGLDELPKEFTLPSQQQHSAMSNIPWKLYLMIGAGILFFAIAIIVILKIRRKRISNPVIPVVEIQKQQQPVRQANPQLAVGTEPPIAKQEFQNSPTPKFCPQCGNQLKPGIKFCGKCGKKMY
jgi:hypothetical protein